VPTKAFPHPLSRFPYSKSWHTENYVSYEIVDRALWLTFERDLNQFRVSVGLEPFRLGQYGWNLLNYHQVPFVKMWSPSIVPKPKDWPEHVDIVGSFFDIPPSAAPIRNNAGRINRFDTPKRIQSSPIKPLPMNLNLMQKQQGSKLIRSRMFDPKVNAAKLEDSLLPVAREPKEVCPELIEFLEKPGCIVYVGFGSMVVPNLEALVALFLEAAALTKVRLLFQQGWSKIDTNRFEELAKKAQEKAIRVQSMLHSVDIEGSTIFPSNSGDQSSNQNETQSAMTRLEEGADSVVEEQAAHESQPPVQPTSSNWLYSMIQTAVATASPLLSGSTNSAVNNSSTSASKPILKEKIDEWDDLSNDVALINTWNWETDAFYMAECPHTWLFQQVSAVVHHGGAGTTSTGLRYGRPTWICPFFGDQFFWGEMIYRGNLGPKPCPVGNLNLMEVVSAFEVLQRESTQHAAEKVGESMARENGVDNAVRAFYQHLPLENMVCDVSLMMTKRNGLCSAESTDENHLIPVPTELAQVYCVQCGLKMTQENADMLHSDASLHMQDHEILPCCYFDWSIPKPETATDGVVQGVGGYVHEFLEGVADVVYDPVHGGMKHGLQGAASGLVKGLNTFVDRQIQGGAVLVEKIVDGVSRSGKHKRDEREEWGGPTQSLAPKGGLLVQGQQIVQSAASDLIRAGAHVIAGATAGASEPANTSLYDISSPSSTIISPHGRPHYKPEAADTLQNTMTSAMKKPARFIDHRASAKTLEVRSLRTNIHQQIRRLQEQQQAEKDEKRTREQAETVFPQWSREQSGESILCSHQQSSQEGLYEFDGQHNQSFIVHNSSFGGVEMHPDGIGSMVPRSSSSHHISLGTVSFSQEIITNGTVGGQPVNPVTGTPTRRFSSSSSIARGIPSTVAETILERSRESDETPLFSPSAASQGRQENFNDSKVILPAILFQGSLDDALKSSLDVTPLDPFETELTNEQESLSDKTSDNFDTATSTVMSLPSPLPPMTTSAVAGCASFNEAVDQFILRIPRDDVSVLSGPSPGVNLMGDIGNCENTIENVPILAQTVTVERVSLASSPKLLHFDQDAALNKSRIALPPPTEPSLLDLSLSKLAAFSNPTTVAADAPIESHDLLGLTSMSDEQQVVSRIVSGDGPNSEYKEIVTETNLVEGPLAIAVFLPELSQQHLPTQLMNSHNAPTLLSPDANEPSPISTQNLSSFQSLQRLPPGDSPSRNNGDESPIFVTSQVPSQLPTPYRTDSQPQESAISAVLSGPGSEHSGYGLGLLEASSNSSSQLARFPSFPLISNFSGPNQSNYEERLEEKEENEKLRRFQEVKEAFYNARAALGVFDRLSGGYGNGNILTRIWSEKKFANVLQLAISRYETIMDSDVNLNGDVLPTAGNDDGLYISPPRRTLSMEDAIVRRLEHREALLKHLLKSITREHNSLTFVDFMLLYSSMVMSSAKQK
jgi:hypothetical protein